MMRLINERESENKYQIEMILSNILIILEHSETGIMMIEPELKKQPYQWNERGVGGEEEVKLKVDDDDDDDNVVKNEKCQLFLAASMPKV